MISYDTNVVIYALEGNAEFGHRSRELMRKGAKEGLCLSVLVKQEILTGAILLNGDEWAVRETFKSAGLGEFMEITDEVIEKALFLTKKYGRKCAGYDAANIATAILGGATEYYTNDSDLVRCGIEEIQILSIK